MVQQKNHSIIITGASRGLGYELAKILANAGRQVIAVSRNEQRLKNLCEKHQNIEILAGDITEYEVRQTLLQKALTYSPVHIVHNAALVMPGFLQHLPEKNIDACFHANLIAPLKLTCELSQTFENSRMLNIGSGLAHFALQGLGNYCITKSGMYMLFKQINSEWPAHHLIAGSLLPGMMDTAMHNKIADSPYLSQKVKDDFQTYKANVTVYQPEEVAVFAQYVLLNTSDDTFQQEVKYIRDYDFQYLVGH